MKYLCIRIHPLGLVGRGPAAVVGLEDEPTNSDKAMSRAIHSVPEAYRELNLTDLVSAFEKDNRLWPIVHRS